MPPETVAAIVLLRLARELRQEIITLRNITEDVARVGPAVGADFEALSSRAVRVHAWYTCLEATFERISRVLEGAIPAGATSHRDLLRQMTLDLPPVRGAVVRPELFPDLADLLGFRHFFRHAYTLDYRADDIESSRSRLTRVAPDVLADLGAFCETLEAQARAGLGG